MEGNLFVFLISAVLSARPVAMGCRPVGHFENGGSSGK